MTVRGRLSATNGEAPGFALEAGLGLLPDFLAWDALVAGRRVAVMRAWSPAPTAIHRITPAGRPRPPRIAVLLDFLAHRFGSGAAPWTAPLPEAWLRPKRCINNTSKRLIRWRRQSVRGLWSRPLAQTSDRHGRRPAKEKPG